MCGFEDVPMCGFVNGKFNTNGLTTDCIKLIGLIDMILNSLTLVAKDNFKRYTPIIFNLRSFAFGQKFRSLVIIGSRNS
jgi:hypothetical protein